MRDPIPLLSTDSSLLVNCQLIAWETGGLGGLITFSPNANAELTQLVTANARGKHVYIDFTNIDEFASRTVYEIVESANSCGAAKLTFVSTGDALRNHLLRYEGFELAGNKVFYRGKPIAVLKELPPKLRAAEIAFARAACISAFRRNPRNQLERLRSSLLMSNGLFDAGLLAQNPKQFAWVSLLLSRLVRKEIATLDTSSSSSISRPIRLVSASLRGGLFAAAVAGLSGPSLEFVPIDHFGPVTRLVERPRSITDALFECDAIMIADIISGGTELKITRSFLEWHRWRLASAISIAVMWPPETYSAAGDIIIHPLFVLPNEIRDLRLELPELHPTS